MLRTKNNTHAFVFNSVLFESIVKMKSQAWMHKFCRQCHCRSNLEGIIFCFYSFSLCLSFVEADYRASKSKWAIEGLEGFSARSWKSASLGKLSSTETGEGGGPRFDQKSRQDCIPKLRLCAKIGQPFRLGQRCSITAKFVFQSLSDFFHGARVEIVIHYDNEASLTKMMNDEKWELFWQRGDRIFTCTPYNLISGEIIAPIRWKHSSRYHRIRR